MTQFARVLIVPVLFALAACTSMSSPMAPAPVNVAAPQPIIVPTTTPSPAQNTQAALQTTDVAPFIDAGALSLLGASDKSSASTAQFYALQYGRPGAPRQWQGSSGISGTVSVGPYVRVNNLDCREFTHSVTVSGKAYERKGTACREVDGRWTVAAS